MSGYRAGFRGGGGAGVASRSISRSIRRVIHADTARSASVAFASAKARCRSLIRMEKVFFGAFISCFRIALVLRLSYMRIAIANGCQGA